jgi:hypothetical protein
VDYLRSQDFSEVEQNTDTTNDHDEDVQDDGSDTEQQQEEEEGESETVTQENGEETSHAYYVATKSPFYLLVLLALMC